MIDYSIDERILERKRKTNIIVKQRIPDAIQNSTKIFVVGPPRSGTTLVYNMIANEFFLPECTFVSTLMKVFNETYKFSDDERFKYYGRNLTNLVEIFKKPIYDFLYSATAKVGGDLVNRFIYKDPMLTPYLEYFQLFFAPYYKIVFVVRDPRDVVSSMYVVLKKLYAEMDDNTLFDKAIDDIFLHYNKIHNMDNEVDSIDKTKIAFVKYEHIVADNEEAIQGLENFLGFELNFQGGDIGDKLSETSAFYSENYGKSITTKSIGKYRNSLSSKQVEKVEQVFSYYMEKFNYVDPNPLQNG